MYLGVRCKIDRGQRCDKEASNGEAVRLRNVGNAGTSEGAQILGWGGYTTTHSSSERHWARSADEDFFAAERAVNPELRIISDTHLSDAASNDPV